MSALTAWEYRLMDDSCPGCGERPCTCPTRDVFAAADEAWSHRDET